MRSVSILVLLCTLAIASCTSNESAKAERKKEDHLLLKPAKPIVTVPSLFNTDTLIVTAKAAVFYQPDSAQIERRMKEVGEKDFRMGMDDYLFYLNESWTYLKQQGVPVVDAKDKKVIQFISANHKIQLVRLDTVPELWGVYLFDPARSPYPADITNIEEAYRSYYK
jgi:hypothetical protein